MPVDEEGTNATLSSPPSVIAEKAGLPEVKCWSRTVLNSRVPKEPLISLQLGTSVRGSPGPIAAVLAGAH